MSNNFNEITGAIIGAAIEVHKELGPGFLEAIYEEALAIELIDRHLAFERQKIINVRYKQKLIGESRLDFLVANQVIVELKAVDSLHPVHTAQVISYLKTTGLRLGLLINFNTKILKHGIQRIVLD